MTKEELDDIIYRVYYPLDATVGGAYNFYLANNPRAGLAGVDDWIIDRKNKKRIARGEAPLKNRLAVVDNYTGVRGGERLVEKGMSKGGVIGKTLKGVGKTVKGVGKTANVAGAVAGPLMAPLGIMDIYTGLDNAKYDWDNDSEAFGEDMSSIFWGPVETMWGVQGIRDGVRAAKPAVEKVRQTVKPAADRVKAAPVSQRIERGVGQAKGALKQGLNTVEKATKPVVRAVEKALPRTTRIAKQGAKWAAKWAPKIAKYGMKAVSRVAPILMFFDPTEEPVGFTREYLNNLKRQQEIRDGNKMRYKA